MTLGEALRDRRGNNLDLLRLLLAASVLISHAWPLARGAGTPEPLSSLSDQSLSLGGWAVAGFFFLSGLLISESAARRDGATFWLSRARRILPGLAVALLVTLALAALSGGALTLRIAGEYLIRGLTLVSLEHRIPGAYASNPYPEAVNGPLWSLFHEVTAYVFCFVAVKSGLMTSRIGAVAFGIGVVALWLVAPLTGIARVETFAPLFVAYGGGMLAWRFADRVPLKPELAILMAIMATTGIWPLQAATLGYALILLGWAVPVQRMPGDLSFGLYIYGWPVAQIIVHMIPDLTPLGLALISLVATLPVAAASWYLVEKPALRRRPPGAAPPAPVAG